MLLELKRPWLALLALSLLTFFLFTLNEIFASGGTAGENWINTTFIAGYSYLTICCIFSSIGRWRKALFVSGFLVLCLIVAFSFFSPPKFKKELADIEAEVEQRIQERKVQNNAEN